MGDGSVMMGDPYDIPLVHGFGQEIVRWRERAEAAEARCARLQQALTKISKRTVNLESFRQLDGEDVQTFAAGMSEAYDDCRAIAREALAGPDTDSQEPCTNCDGLGHNTAWPHTTCPVCHGSGADNRPEETTSPAIRWMT